MCHSLKSLSGIRDSEMEGGHKEMSRDPVVRVQLSVVATLVKMVKTGNGRGGLQQHCLVLGTEITRMEKRLPGCQLVDTPVF